MSIIKPGVKKHPTKVRLGQIRRSSFGHRMLVLERIKNEDGSLDGYRCQNQDTLQYRTIDHRNMLYHYYKVESEGNSEKKISKTKKTILRKKKSIGEDIIDGLTEILKGYENE